MISKHPSVATRSGSFFNNGEEIAVARAGQPIPKLIAVGPVGGTRPMGIDEGKIWMAEDFDAPNPALEVQLLWAGR